ncbi:MAG: hypothetical protein VKJ04_08390 [Vampirovibrionales bacterium]|nr:hypothetical protein [Vampirovibrionales bacterium]
MEWLVEAQTCLKEIETLSRDILRASQDMQEKSAKKPATPENAIEKPGETPLAIMAQNMMRRGEFIKRLTLLLSPQRTQHLDEETRLALHDCIEGIRQMDQQVEPMLNASLSKMEQGLKSLEKGRKLLKRYELPTGSRATTTRSSDA